MRRRLMGNSKLKATLVQHLDTQGGEVVFYDIESNAFLYYRLDDGEDIVPKTCVPIGFVAIPASENFYEDYACGVMSLGYMSCSNIEGSKDNEPMMWGNDAILITADNNTNGKINTQKIIEARGALEGLPNPSLAADYPAASICNMYYTEGTKAGDWYLPAATELTTAVSFLQDLPNVIKKLRNVYDSYKIMNDGLYSVWSSTEYGEQYAYWIDSVSDDYIEKTVELGVVAFTQFGALQRNYGDIFISGGAVSDIPASGGETQVSGYTYSQTYGYGDSTTNGGTITSGADIKVTSVSADTLGTTEKERTKVGESILTVTMNGKSAIASYEVYQEANIKTVTGTSGGDITYGNVIAGSITNGWVGAGGGTGTGYAGNGSQSWSKSAITTYYSYTSGATSSAITTAASSGTNSIAPSRSSYSVSPGSRGTTVGDVLTWSAGVTWSGNAGKSASGTIYVQQAANVVTSTTWYNNSPGVWANKTVNSKSNNVTVVSGTGISENRLILSIPEKESGSANITIQCVGTAYYSSGSSQTVNLSLYSLEIDPDSDAYEVGVSISNNCPNFTITFNDCSAYNVYNNSFIEMGIAFGSQLYVRTVIEVQRP